MISSSPRCRAARRSSWKSVAAGMRNGDPCGGPCGDPGQDAEERRAGNTQQDRAIDLASHQNESEHDAETGGEHFFRREAAEADERGGIRDYKLCVAQSDEGDEHADAGGGRVLQAVGNAVDDLFADAGDGQQDEQDPGKEHDTQRSTPGNAHAQADGIGEVSVQRHAGSHRDGIIRVKTHHERRDRRRNARGEHHAFGRHSCLGKDLGIHDDDVGHRHEGRDAAD